MQPTKEQQLTEAINDFTGGQESHTPLLVKRIMEIFALPEEKKNTMEKQFECKTCGATYKTPTESSGSVAAPKEEPLKELVREMVALFDVVRSDMIDDGESPNGWMIPQLNSIIEKGQALLDKQ